MSSTHVSHRVAYREPTEALVLPTPPSPGPAGKPSGPNKPLFTPHRAVVMGTALLVVVGAGLGTWLATRPASTSATTRIVTVGYGTISQTASATGTIAAASTANVNFAVSGRINAIDITVGQTVAAGQTLATIDPTALTYQVDEAQANLASAQAKLSADQSVSSTPTAQITADNAAVTAAQASLSAAQTSLSNATLTSPIAGVVAAMNLTMGQQVSGSAGNSSSSGTSGAGSPTSSGSASSYNAGSSSSISSSSSGSSSSNAQIVVLGTGSYVVNASVDDTEVGELQVGDQCAITPEGSTTAVYGQIASVSIMATQSSGVASFPVVIDVTGSPSGLYPGATAEISILVKELQNVLVVPTAAIRFVGGNTVVDVIHNGKQSVRPVTIGTASGGNTEVISGVQAGEQVVEHVTSTRAPTGTPSSGYSRTGGFGGGLGGGLGGLGGNG